MRTDENDQVVGMAVGTLDARESMRTLREHSISLALATVFGVLRQPQLVPGLISRYRSVSSNSDKEFIVTSGARSMYWGVLPEGAAHIRGHHPDAKVVGGHAGPRRRKSPWKWKRETKRVSAAISCWGRKLSANL